jgi:hypothetical protein
MGMLQRQQTWGSAVGLAALITIGNPAGLIVSTGMKMYGEKSGRNMIESRAKWIPQEIGDAVKNRESDTSSSGAR